MGTRWSNTFGRVSVAATMAAALGSAGTALGVTALENRYSFSEVGGSGTTLVDSVSGEDGSIVEVGANNATVGGGVLTLAGGARASSDYGRLGASGGNLLSGFTDATIELWATQNVVQNWSRIFDVGQDTDSYLFMSFTQGTNINSDRVEIRDGGTTSTLNNAVQPYTLNQQFHIVMTIEEDGGGAGVNQIKVYKNGLLEGTLNTTVDLGSLDTPYDFLLGRSQFAGDNTASATYDEARIYSKTLSQHAVTADLNLGTEHLANSQVDQLVSLMDEALVVYQFQNTLDLNGPTQTNFTSVGSFAVGQSNNGSSINAVNSDGSFGGLANEGGGVSFGEALNPAELQHGGSYSDLTMFGRVRFSSFSGIDDIWRFGEAGSTAEDFFALQFDNGTPRFVVMQDGTLIETTLNFGQALSANAWYDITGVFNGSAQTMTLYVYDATTGMQVGSAASLFVGFSSIEGDNAGSENLLLLEAPSNANGTNAGGQLDLVSFWDRALSGDEVALMSLVVPEPTTLSLLALSGLALLRRRRIVA